MKRSLVTILVLILGLGSFCYSAENSAKRPEGTEPVAVEAGELTALNGTEVLVIKDNDPWDDDGNVEALVFLGKTYEVINTSDIATTTLSNYRIVIVASDQTTATYDALIAAAGDLANYVSGGGILLAHACDEGWNMGHWSSSWLPGGVNHVDTYQELLSIVDTTSPIVNGITDADLDNWGWSTHGYFTDLVAATNIVIGITGDPTGQPTYVEYRYGLGWVLANMQTIEWPWAIGAGTTQLLINEILYAQTLKPEVVIDIKPGSFPNSINPNSNGVIPVAILTTSIADGDPVDFDATMVDAATVRFGYCGGASMAHKQAHLEDVDYDGDVDMLLHFRTQETHIWPGDTGAPLWGETVGGASFVGYDSVRTVPPS